MGQDDRSGPRSRVGRRLNGLTCRDARRGSESSHSMILGRVNGSSHIALSPEQQLWRGDGLFERIDAHHPLVFLCGLG